MSRRRKSRTRIFDQIPLWIASTLFASFLLYTAWDMAWSLSSNAAYAEGNSKYYAADAAHNIQRGCFLPNVNTAECIRDTVESTHEHQRAEADLEAQRNMAHWAMWMVIISMASIVVGAVGIIFVYRTLKETRKGNRINRKIGEAQVRAYLTVPRAEIIQALEGSNRAGPSLKLWVQNSGATPAVNVSYFCRLDTTTQFFRHVLPVLEKVPFDQFIGSIPASAESGFEAMAYNLLAAFHDFTLAMSKTDPKTTRMGDYPLIVVHGVLFYDDVFGKSYRSSFAFLLDDPRHSGPLDVIQASIPTFVAIANRDHHRESNAGT